MAPSVLGFGDNFIDKFVDRQVYYPGGNAVNFAVFAAARGARAAYLGAFADDDLAAHLRTTLTELEISTEWCQTRHGETGWAEVEVVDGDRVFLRWNGGGVTTREPLVLGADEIAYASTFDLVHSGVYAQSTQEMPKLAGVGPLLSFDFSEEEEFRTDEYLAALCPGLDLALFSAGESDRDALADTLRRASAHGCGQALGTLGPRGSLLFDGTRLYQQDAILLPNPVDTMGCGDSFVAAFAVHALTSGWTRGIPLPEDVVVRGLRSSAEFAAAQTLTEGAFQHGRSY